MIWNLRSPAEWLMRALGVTSTTGEPFVNSESMLSSAAIWYAVNTIAGDVGKMPLEPRRLEDRSNSIDKASPWYRVLRDEANDWQTSDVFKEQLHWHALGWGNGRAYIDRRLGREALIPMRPDATETLMYRGEKWHVTQPDADDPLFFYEELRTSLEIGKLSDRLYAVPDRDVLHIMGFSTYGVQGKSVADVFREIIGTDLSAQRYNKDQLNKGMAARMMLEAPPGSMQDEDEAALLLKNFRQSYSRKNDGEVVGMLRDGIKAVDVSRMSNVDAQFLEQRRFTRQDIMLIFGLQHIPGDDSATSYNGLENSQLAYLASCLSRWLTRWEMQCDMKLRTEAEKRIGNTYFKFNRGTWLQMDAQSTANVLNSYVASMVISRNEARDKLDLNPVEGGDVFENPHTTSGAGRPPAEQDDDQEADDGEEQQAQALRRVVQRTAAHVAASVLFDRFLETECDRIEKATGNKNIVDWIDRNYATWQQTYERQAEAIGVDAAPFVADLLERKQQLLTACECQPDELKDKIANLLTEWRTGQ
jgi:HK97 family phage portal protein